jgi:hypothetical protein
MLGINQVRLFSPAFYVQDNKTQQSKPVLKTLDKDTVSFGNIISAERYKELLMLTRGHVNDPACVIKLENDLAAARFIQKDPKVQTEKTAALKKYLQDGPPPAKFKDTIELLARSFGVKMPNYSEKVVVKSPHPKLSDIPPYPWDSHRQRQVIDESKLTIQTSDPALEQTAIISELKPSQTIFEYTGILH